MTDHDDGHSHDWKGEHLIRGIRLEVSRSSGGLASALNVGKHKANRGKAVLMAKRNAEIKLRHKEKNQKN